MPSRVFALVITEEHDAYGRTINRYLQSDNTGIEKEIVLTLTRNWLRLTEDNFHAEKFKGKSE